MAIELQIGNVTYNYPEDGENPGWGEEATAWAEAVTDLLGTLRSGNDIALTTVSLANNQSTAANVTGLAFNLNEIIQFKIEYTVKRIYDSGSSVVVETGEIYGTHDGSTTTLSQESSGGISGVDFSISAGQIQYTSTDLANHQSSVITYKASTMS
jgi:hypothetical protein